MSAQEVRNSAKRCSMKVTKISPILIFLQLSRNSCKRNIKTKDQISSVKNAMITEQGDFIYCLEINKKIKVY